MKQVLPTKEGDGQDIASTQRKCGSNWADQPSSPLLTEHDHIKMHGASSCWDPHTPNESERQPHATTNALPGEDCLPPDRECGGACLQMALQHTPPVGSHMHVGSEHEADGVGGRNAHEWQAQEPVANSPTRCHAEPTDQRWPGTWEDNMHGNLSHSCKYTFEML